MYLLGVLNIYIPVITEPWGIRSSIDMRHRYNIFFRNKVEHFNDFIVNELYVKHNLCQFISIYLFRNTYSVLNK